MKHALVIEDDATLAELVEIHLQDLGYTVTKSLLGLPGQQLALEKPFDLLILDLMLPDADGVDICRKLRQEKIGTPVIMLTARSEEIDKVLGLETGADDYITKPFSVREFIARVKAVARRSSHNLKEEDEQQLAFNGLRIDPDKRLVFRNEERIELTPKEFDLLLLMAQHPGRSYSRENLLNLIWGYQYHGYEHTVNSHINRLRAKIEEEPADPKYILTTWGIGYRFNDTLSS